MTEQMTLGGNGKTRADQIFERWATFHKANPVVYRLFRERSDHMRRRFKTYSSRTVYGNVRYDLDLRATKGQPKLNDHYSTYYARLYMVDRNCHGFYETRKRTSEDVPAYKTDLAFHHTGPAADEETLMRKLRQLLEESNDQA